MSNENIRYKLHSIRTSESLQWKWLNDIKLFFECPMKTFAISEQKILSNQNTVFSQAMTLLFTVSIHLQSANRRGKVYFILQVSHIYCFFVLNLIIFISYNVIYKFFCFLY